MYYAVCSEMFVEKLDGGLTISAQSVILYFCMKKGTRNTVSMIKINILYLLNMLMFIFN